MRGCFSRYYKRVEVLRKKRQVYTGLPLNTVIEVVSVNAKGDRYICDMTLKDARKIERKKGWNYSFYKLGFSAYKNAKRIKK